MAKQTNVEIINECSIKKGEWTLCFQWCTYHYFNDDEEDGYRFIWRRPDGSLQPARGQARLPSITDIYKLTQIAFNEGWGSYSETNEKGD